MTTDPTHDARTFTDREIDDEIAEIKRDGIHLRKTWFKNMKPEWSLFAIVRQLRAERDAARAEIKKLKVEIANRQMNMNLVLKSFNRESEGE